MKPEAAKNVKHTPLTPEEDKIYMKKALKQAEHALALGEVPIGCVIVYDKKIIGRGFNKRNTKKTAMYITLEPCQMCSGAIVQSRIDRIVIGAMNPKAGCAGSILNLLNRPEFNHQVEITKDICAAESTEILQRFFKDLRVRNKT